MAVAHQSPASTLPPFQYKTVNTQTWAITGNTDVVTDGYVYSNSIILIVPSSAYAGRWSVTIPATGGSFTVTSSSSEANTVTYSYIVL
jgi:hypothetical protein